MLNKEYYKDLLIDSVVDSYSIAINRETNEPCKCTSISCQHCAFNISTSSSLNECNRMRKKWANSEYKEPKVDWNKVPVDTPIFVPYNSVIPNTPRHFSHYDVEHDLVFTFSDGTTSFTASLNMEENWNSSQVVLANKEDMMKYKA